MTMSIMSKAYELFEFESMIASQISKILTNHASALLGQDFDGSSTSNLAMFLLCLIVVLRGLHEVVTVSA